MVYRTLVSTAAKRIPLIKFRKGGLPLASDKSAGHTQTASTASTTVKASASHSRGPTIEDWELPPRYWRKPIGDTEMDYINRGGPA